MTRFWFSLLFCYTSLAAAADPDYLKDLKPYEQQQHVTGTIRVYGNNYIPALMKQWEDGFRKYQPDIEFNTNLPGTEAAIAGLYADRADLAFVGREGYRAEINGFKGRFGYEPLGIEISSGSFSTPHKTFSLQIFVNKQNPLTKLTMAQAEAIFGCGGPGGKPSIRVWGALGLSGTWAEKPIHVYGYNFDTGMAGFFDRVVLHDNHRWNDELKDFDNGKDEKGEVINAGVYILQALAKDPVGIAFANVLYANPEVRALALANKEAGPYVEATKETTWKREYPITRFTTVYLNRPPGIAVQPKLKEFLRYILSRDGMGAVVQDGSYLPLNEKLIQQQLQKLE